MDSQLAQYEIYEGMETDAVGDYLRQRSIGVGGMYVEMRKFKHYAIYIVEITDEEASFIMLSIPDIDIRKCKKVNSS